MPSHPGSTGQVAPPLLFDTSAADSYARAAPESGYTPRAVTVHLRTFADPCSGGNHDPEDALLLFIIASIGPLTSPPSVYAIRVEALVSFLGGTTYQAVYTVAQSCPI